MAGSLLPKTKIHPALRGLRKREKRKKETSSPRVLSVPGHRRSFSSADEERHEGCSSPHGTLVSFFPHPALSPPYPPSSKQTCRAESGVRRGSTDCDRGECFKRSEREKALPPRYVRKAFQKNINGEDFGEDGMKDTRQEAYGLPGYTRDKLDLDLYGRDGSEEDDEEEAGGHLLPSPKTSSFPGQPRVPTAPLRKDTSTVMGRTESGSLCSRPCSVQLSPTSSSASNHEYLSPISPDSFEPAKFSFPQHKTCYSLSGGSRTGTHSPTSFSDLHMRSSLSGGRLSSGFSPSEGCGTRTFSTPTPPGTANRMDGRKGSGGEAIRVVVRCRPPLTPAEKKEEGIVFFYCQKGEVSTVHHSDRGKDLCWHMDKAIWSGEGPAADGTPSASQTDVYMDVGRPLLLHALEGYNSTLLAYGPTGSGKTYTMMGKGSKSTDPTASGRSSELGIIPRLCYELFEEIGRRTSSCGNRRRSDVLRRESMSDANSSGSEGGNMIREEKEDEENSSFFPDSMLHDTRARSGETGEVLVFSNVGSSCWGSSTQELVGDGPLERTASVERSVWEVHARYVEIYCERITDLLNNGSPVTLREETIHAEGGLNGRSSSGCGGTTPYVTTNSNINQNGLTAFCLSGAKRIKAVCGDDLLKAFNTGNKWRHTAATKVNDQSSRSHAIFIIELTEVLHFTDLDGNPSCARNKSLAIRLVDLAGSERISKTGAEGKLFKEAKDINLSLFTLGRVIESLTEGKGGKNRIGGGSGRGGGGKHTPYRSSTLTKILRDAFGGDSKTTLIATLVPFASSRQETIQTLNYAARARHVVNRPRLAEIPGTLGLRKAMKELDALRKELEVAQSGGIPHHQQALEWMSAMEASEESRLEHEATVKALHEQLQEANERLRREQSLAREQYESMQEREANLEKLLWEKENETQEIHFAYKENMRALKEKINSNKREQRKYGKEMERARLEAEAQMRDIQEEHESTEQRLRQREEEARLAHKELSARLKKTSIEATRKLELMEQKQHLLEEELKLKEEESKWMEAEAMRKYARAKEALECLEAQRLEKEAEDMAALQALEEERLLREKELQEQVSHATANLKQVEKEAREQASLLESKWVSAEEQAVRLEEQMKSQQEEIEKRLREAQDEIEHRETVLKLQLRETEEELCQRQKAAINEINKLETQKREMKKMYDEKISRMEEVLLEEKTALEQRAKDAEAHVKTIEEASKREMMALNEKCLQAEKRSKEVEESWNLKQKSVRQELAELEHGYKKKEADLEAALEEQMQQAKKELQERQSKVEAEFFESMEECRSREEKVQREHREVVAEIEKAKSDAQRRAQLAEREKELLEKEIQMKKDQLELVEAEAKRRKKMVEEVIPQLEAEVADREAQFARRMDALKAEIEKRDEELRQQAQGYQKQLSQAQEEAQSELEKMRKKWIASEERVGELKGFLEYTQGERCQEVLVAQLEGRKRERILTAALEEKDSELMKEEGKRATQVEEIRDAAEKREKDLKDQLAKLSRSLEMERKENIHLTEKHERAMEGLATAEGLVGVLTSRLEDQEKELEHCKGDIEVFRHDQEERKGMAEEWEEKLLRAEEEILHLSVALETERLAQKVVLEEKNEEVEILRKENEAKLSEEKEKILSLEEQLRSVKAHILKERIAGLKIQDAMLNDADVEFQSTASIMTAATAEVRQLKDALETLMKKNKELECEKESLKREQENTNKAHSEELQTLGKCLKEKEKKFAKTERQMNEKWKAVNAAVDSATDEVEKMKEQYDLLQGTHQALLQRLEEAQRTHDETLETVSQLQKEKEKILAKKNAEKIEMENHQKEHQTTLNNGIKALEDKLAKKREEGAQQQAAWIAERTEKEAELQKVKEVLKEVIERQDRCVRELRQQEEMALKRCKTLEKALQEMSDYLNDRMKLLEEHHLEILEAQLVEVERLVAHREQEWKGKQLEEVLKATRTCTLVAEEEAAGMALAFTKELERWKKDVEAEREAVREEAEVKIKEIRAQVNEEIEKVLGEANITAAEKRVRLVEEAEKKYQTLADRITESETRAKLRESAFEEEIQMRNEADQQLVEQLEETNREVKSLREAYTTLQEKERASKEQLHHQLEECKKRLGEVSEEKEKLDTACETLRKMVKKAELQKEKSDDCSRNAVLALDEAKENHKKEMESTKRACHACCCLARERNFKNLIELEEKQRRELKSRYFHEVFLLQKIEQLEGGFLKQHENRSSPPTPPGKELELQKRKEEEERKAAFLALRQNEGKCEKLKNKMLARERILNAQEASLAHQREALEGARGKWERDHHLWTDQLKGFRARETKQEEREGLFHDMEGAMTESLAKCSASLSFDYASKSYCVLCEREQVAFKGLLTQHQMEMEKLFRASAWKLGCEKAIGTLKEREKRLDEESIQLAAKLHGLREAEAAQRAANERDEAALMKIAEELRERRSQAELIAQKSSAQLVAVALEKEELQRRKDQVEDRARVLRREQLASEAETKEAEAELVRREKAMNKEVREKMAQIEDARTRLADFEAKSALKLQILEEEWSQMEARQKVLEVAVIEKEEALALVCKSLEKVQAKEQALENLLRECHAMLDGEHDAKVKGRKTAAYLTSELLVEQEQHRAEVEIWKRSFAILRCTGEVVCPQCNWKDKRQCNSCRCCGLSFEIAPTPLSSSGETFIPHPSVKETTGRNFSTLNAEHMQRRTTADMNVLSSEWDDSSRQDSGCTPSSSAEGTECSALTNSPSTPSHPSPRPVAFSSSSTQAPSCSPTPSDVSPYPPSARVLPSTSSPQTARRSSDNANKATLTTFHSSPISGGNGSIPTSSSSQRSPSSTGDSSKAAHTRERVETAHSLVPPPNTMGILSSSEHRCSSSRVTGPSPPLSSGSSSFPRIKLVTFFHNEKERGISDRNNSSERGEVGGRGGSGHGICSTSDPFTVGGLSQSARSDSGFQDQGELDGCVDHRSSTECYVSQERRISNGSMSTSPSHRGSPSPVPTRAEGGQAIRVSPRFPVNHDSTYSPNFVFPSGTPSPEMPNFLRRHLALSHTADGDSNSPAYPHPPLFAPSTTPLAVSFTPVISGAPRSVPRNVVVRDGDEGPSVSFPLTHFSDSAQVTSHK